MTVLQAGKVVSLQVERRADFGFFLTDGVRDVLLHESEIHTPVELGRFIDVFLYTDKQDRLAATTQIPSIQAGTFGWGKVVDVLDHVGAFVNIGIQKEVLLSKDDLPKLKDVWPLPGFELYVTLKTDNKGRLLAQLAKEEDILDIATYAPQEMFNKDIKGRVYRAQKVGSFLITEEGYRCFVHESQRKSEPRLGEIVTGRVIDVKEGGTLNVSLLPRKQDSIEADADRIYQFMKTRGGSMPYGDKSRAEDIKLDLSMSKAAFKRALGKLMKEKRVFQEDGWTHFTERKQ